MNYQPIIGLEIHVELKTQSKMFCGCPNDPEAKEPNINICPVCTGQPGSLPVINHKAVEYTLKTALALNCQIPEFSKFDRKNYFYPDLPKGYQISQYDKPLSINGFLELEFRACSGKIPQQAEESRKRIRIRRVHLEEDTGKLIHLSPAQLSKKVGRAGGKDYSLVDFNRAGVPLMELVTEPDISSPQEARKLAQELQLILRYLDVSDADMEKGQLRVEANISLLPLKSEIRNPKSETNSKFQIPDSRLGTKVEIKNLNSFKAVERALEYEIIRQKDLLESGEKVIQETRGWDENKQKTFSQRGKEEAEDYRYFPEPDLPILSTRAALGQPCFARAALGLPLCSVPAINIEKIKSELPELPQARRKRFVKEYQLPEKDIETLVMNKDLADYFEQVCSELTQTEEVGPSGLPKRRPERSGLQKLYKLAANYLLTEIPRIANMFQVFILRMTSRRLAGFHPADDQPKAGRFQDKITPENFAEFIVLIAKGEISSSAAQIVLKEMFQTGADPSHIIEAKGLKQVSDEAAISKIVEQVIKNHPQPVKDYQVGKENALQFLVGQVMKETKGKINPQIASQILKERLKSACG